MAFKKKNLLSELLGLDAKEDILGLLHEDQARRTQVKGEIEVLASMEETFWRQKSHALFVKEGDNNTHLFHRLANSNRRANRISSVEVDVVLYKDEPAVLAQVAQFYQELYIETDTWRPTMDGLDFASIGEDDRLSLEREFSKEEVSQALAEMEGAKALGPNGFTLAFFHKCWRVVEANVIVVFNHFHRYSVFERSLNASFLTLVPKKSVAVNIKDFRILV